MAHSEKEQFLQAWEKEYQTTLKVFKAYPAARADLRPHPKSPTASELAWRMVGEESLFINGVINGQINFSGQPAAPSTLGEILQTYEKNHKEWTAKLRGVPDDVLNRNIKFMVAPKTPGDVRSGDILWFFLMDTIHHRGQFSVYLRMADGKVPSIYGPSGDEPWM
ncbi:MAG TPA: DinB family protein [Bacteroidota bacterium]|nr:DinB family protein [Bacteroidota bacterium]